MANIHSTAIVDPKAEIGNATTIKPYTIIGPDVKIGSGNEIGPHAVIEGNTTIGDNNVIYPFVSIGMPPQDITYKGEPTEVIIGDGNIIREGVTIHRGTSKGIGYTKIGNFNYLMAWCHIAHDCILGNHIIIANGAMLGGHVTIGDHAVLGGLVAVHQFVRIGEHAFIGGKSAVSMDIPPYMLVASERSTKVFGPNKVGLKRKGFSDETIRALRKAYKTLFRSGLTLQKATSVVRETMGNDEAVSRLLDFIEAKSIRGITR